MDACSSRPGTAAGGCWRCRDQYGAAVSASAWGRQRWQIFIGQLGTTRKTERTRIQADHDRAIRVVAAIAALFHDNEALRQHLHQGATTVVTPIRARGPRQGR
ncbi:hypothetical protein ABTY61_32265 [Kitasatospora sp. NPDC096128]|uniref:hypothetical protein n=1 Tax=Kitasatospora sp. NPDC096128 TaxID=3155547 RepID=UPI00331B938D